MEVRRLVALLGSLLFCLSPSGIGQDKPPDGVLAMNGSPSVAPVAMALSAHYWRHHPGVKFTCSASGSGNGAKGLILGQCQIALMSRFMNQKEYAAAVDNGVLPTAHVIALEGLAIVVHPDNPVSGLSTTQLRDMFAGRITNWQAVGGPNLDILVIARDTSSAWFETFEKLVMHDKDKRTGQPVTDRARILGSSQSSVRLLQSTPNGIAYCSLPFVSDKVKRIKVDGVPCTVAAVRDGTYPIARPIFLFTNGHPEPGSHLWSFLSLRLTPEGQGIIEDMGLIPMTRYHRTE